MSNTNNVLDPATAKELADMRESLQKAKKEMNDYTDMKEEIIQEVLSQVRADLDYSMMMQGLE
ncbi:MAG: hypothetical protein NC548_64415 [Lachnospiraceae bacterium]|nr:hypothetical protein [Lachnospiraceae bacterium]